MTADTTMNGSRVVVLLAAAVSTLGACGDDDASETAATAGQESVPAVTSESTVNGSTTDGPGTTAPSTTLGDGEPWVAYTIWGPTDEPEGLALVHPDGSDDHEILAELPYPALNPDWSPDGTRLAVQIYSRDSVWIANADGSESEAVARCTAPCAALADPAWSPSGEQLLVTRLDDTDPFDRTVPEGMPTAATVEVVDVRTGERRDVQQSAYPEELRNPTWSPDGSSYAVTVRRYDEDGEPTGSAIAVGGLDGSPLKVLTPFEEWAGPADWHPQDDILVYESGDEAANLFTIRADGSDVQAVTEFEPGGTRAASPGWTPDGERILFTTEDDPSEVDQGAPYLTMASIKPDGTGLERTPLAGRNGYHFTMQPTAG